MTIRKFVASKAGNHIIVTPERLVCEYSGQVLQQGFLVQCFSASKNSEEFVVSHDQITRARTYAQIFPAYSINFIYSVDTVANQWRPIPFDLPPELVSGRVRDVFSAVHHREGVNIDNTIAAGRDAYTLSGDETIGLPESAVEEVLGNPSVEEVLLAAPVIPENLAGGYGVEEALQDDDRRGGLGV